MKTCSIFLRVLPALVLSASLSGTFAQQPVTQASRIAVRMEGLTSATRDALARDLIRTDRAHIVFACVPAGILIVEANNAQAPSSMLEEELSSKLSMHARGPGARKVDLTLAEAEAACEQVRGR